MPSEDHDALLPYYMAELDYLRIAGDAFAREHKGVAAAMDLSSHDGTDPQVQRLIESFAFLTARLQRTYDAQFPQIPQALLGTLYPQLVAPVPSMAIASFEVDPRQSRAIAGVSVPAGTGLFALPAGHDGASITEGLTCRFRTGHPVTLWPIEVADARLERRADHPFLDGRPDVQAVLRIRLRCLGNRRFAEFSPEALRFYLPPRGGDRFAIYDMLFTHARGVAVAGMAPDAPPAPPGALPNAKLCGASLRAVGFAAEDALLPCPPPSHQAYRLLQEYFAFPDKFLFADVAGLPPGALGAGTEADILLLLEAPRGPVTVGAGTFALGCAPVINLFPRVTEPIRLDHTRLEYRLVPDARWEGSTEIHSIERVIRTAARTNAAEGIPPLFSRTHADSLRDATTMYHARRQPARANLDGGEILLSFVDANLDPARPAEDTVFAHTLCTNRGVAAQIGAGARLQLELDLPLAGVTCLQRPTPQVPPPTDGATLWRLVSHLSVNHFSISGGEAGLAALREILLLYSPAGDATAARRVGGLTGMTTRRAVRHIGEAAWRGFCRGVEVALEFDEHAFAGTSAYLLGSVLSRFLGLYAPVNSFAQLTMRSQQRDAVWSWPAQTGETILP